MIENAVLEPFLAANNQFIIADCFTFTLKDGTILRYTTFDENITYLTFSFTGNSTIIERGDIKKKIGVQVDTLDINIVPKDQINGKSWVFAFRNGWFDDAELKLERVFLEFTGGEYTVKGGFIHFSGQVGASVPTRNAISTTVDSETVKLNIMMPRRLYSTSCKHVLYDANCGLLKENFASSAVTLAASTDSLIKTSMVADDDIFALGYMEFTTGNLTGQKRSVRSNITSGTMDITVSFPFTEAPATGDSFTIYQGCDKNMGTCDTKFSNLTKFSGEPYVPPPDSVT